MSPATPSPAPSERQVAPVEPCLESFRFGARGANPLDTADPIMAAMGSYFARKEAARRAELAKLLAEARQRLAEEQSG